MSGCGLPGHTACANVEEYRMDENVYVVVKFPKGVWQNIYRGRIATVMTEQIEAVLSAEELRSLNLWYPAKEIAEQENR